MEFYEDYKLWQKTIKDKSKRQNKRKDELIGQLKSILRENCDFDNILSHENLMFLYKNFDNFDSTCLSEEFDKGNFYEILKKYWRSVSSYEQKSELIDQNFISFENWKPKNKISLDSMPNQFDIEKNIMDLVGNTQ